MKKVCIVLMSLALLASCGQSANTPMGDEKPTDAALEAPADTHTPTENTVDTPEEANTPAENSMGAGTALSPVCETYLAHLECIAKQTGVTANTDQIRMGFEAMSTTESEKMCQEGISASKAVGHQVAGCELQ